MFNNMFRKAALACTAAISIFNAVPAHAGGLGEPHIIVTEHGVIVDGQNTRRHHHQAERYDILSPREIVRKLRHQGYAQIHEIGLRHDTYRVLAVRHNGALAKLRVSAHSGQIISSRRIGWVQNAPRRLHDHVRPGFGIQFGWSSD